MSKNTKIVNIYPTMPITRVNPPIRTMVRNVTKSIDEIRACLMARATVEEVLSNGKTVRLDISNYDRCLDCTCGTENNCSCNKPNNEPVATTDTSTKSDWQIAYEKALEGKDLGAMSRKQRRSAEASARAAANAAVANNTTEAPVETDSEEAVETTDDVENEDVVVEETADTEEEEVETLDIEDMDSDVE